MGFLKNFFYRYKEGKLERPPRFPKYGQEIEWMDRILEYYKVVHPEDAHILFSPACVDYLPLSVHVGGNYMKEHIRNHYRKLKSENPDLVARAKEMTLSIGKYNLSRIGDDEDYYGMEVI